MAKGQTQTQTTTIDPQAEAYRNQIYQNALDLPEWQRYQGQMVADPSAMTQRGFQTAMSQDPRLQQGYGGFVENLGLVSDWQRNQLGDAGRFTSADMEAYQNPYQQAVVESMQSDYDRLRAQGLNEVGGSATAANAFGGGRHGLAEATRMAELSRAETGQLAGLRQYGYEQAANRWDQDRQYQARQAQAMANLGFGGGQALNMLQQQRGAAQMGAGEYERNIEQQRMDRDYQQWMQQQQAPYQRLQAQQGNYAAPTGSTTEQFTPWDPWGDFIGIASTFAGGLGGGIAG